MTDTRAFMTLDSYASTADAQNVSKSGVTVNFWIPQPCPLIFGQRITLWLGNMLFNFFGVTPTSLVFTHLRCLDYYAPVANAQQIIE
jgi:hypothetical protein